MTTNGPSVGGSAPESDDSALEHRLARVLQVMLLTGLAVVVLGSALEIAHRGHLGSSTVPVAELASGVAALQGGAILTCGLIILLVAPATGLVYVAVSLAAARDRLHALIAAVVLAILVGSLLVKGAL